MKKITSTTALLLLLLTVQAQQTVDVVQTTSGSMMRGKIFHNDDAVLKIRTADGSVFVINKEEVLSIGMEAVPNSTATMGNGVSKQPYGGPYGLGFGFGDGLVAHYRYVKSSKLAFEAGMGLGSTLAPLRYDPNTGEENPFNTENGFVVEFATHFRGPLVKKTPVKSKSRGLMLRLGHLFGDFSTTSLSGGWASEVFNVRRNPKRSYMFELGLKASIPHWETNTYEYTEPYPVIPYLRFRWTWHMGNSADQQPPSPQMGMAPGAETVQPMQEASLPKGHRPAQPLKKGNIMLATSTGLPGSGSSSDSFGKNAAGFSTREVNGTRRTYVGLTPNAGYFLSDNLLGGVSLSAVSRREKSDYETRNITLLLLGPFVRYYGDLPTNDKMKWTAEAAVAFGREKYKRKLGTQTIEDVDGLFSFSLGPGLAYFLGDRVTVEAQGLYERLSVKDKETEEESSAGNFGLRVGFGVFL